MPWTATDAEKHTRKADTPEKRKRWASIANSVLDETGDDGRAIRTANAKREGAVKFSDADAAAEWAKTPLRKRDSLLHEADVWQDDIARYVRAEWAKLPEYIRRQLQPQLSWGFSASKEIKMSSDEQLRERIATALDLTGSPATAARIVKERDILAEFLDTGAVPIWKVAPALERVERCITNQVGLSAAEPKPLRPAPKVAAPAPKPEWGTPAQRKALDKKYGPVVGSASAAASDSPYDDGKWECDQCGMPSKPEELFYDRRSSEALCAPCLNRLKDKRGGTLQAADPRLCSKCGGATINAVYDADDNIYCSEACKSQAQGMKAASNYTTRKVVAWNRDNPGEEHNLGVASSPLEAEDLVRAKGWRVVPGWSEAVHDDDGVTWLWYVAYEVPKATKPLLRPLRAMPPVTGKFGAFKAPKLPQDGFSTETDLTPLRAAPALSGVKFARGDAAPWWDDLPLDQRRSILAKIGVNSFRIEDRSYDQLPPLVQKKLDDRGGSLSANAPGSVTSGSTLANGIDPKKNKLKVAGTQTCAACGESFTPHAKDQIACSQECQDELDNQMGPVFGPDRRAW